VLAAHTVMTALDARVHAAHGDVWQAEGRLRTALGGGACELPGVRLMSSGLPHAQWNNGDVTDATQFDVEAARAWYAARAHGAGVPWGVRVPAGQAFSHGRLLFRKRCMALLPAQHRVAPRPAMATITRACAADLGALSTVDAEAFGDDVKQVRRWIEPHLDAAGFDVAIARRGSEAVGAATAVRTDDRAGPCVGIFGVGVLRTARGAGIGAALTSWLLERAFAAGATLAHLNPNSDEAARVYARLGFSETVGLDVYTGL
jgi:GNAT superfamily N-acetyltransferase